jgi:hypothetical protein
MILTIPGPLIPLVILAIAGVGWWVGNRRARRRLDESAPLVTVVRRRLGNRGVLVKLHEGALRVSPPAGVRVWAYQRDNNRLVLHLAPEER